MKKRSHPFIPRRQAPGPLAAHNPQLETHVKNAKRAGKLRRIRIVQSLRIKAKLHSMRTPAKPQTKLTIPFWN